MKIVLLLVGLIITTLIPCGSYAKEPYYGYYPSVKGSNHKLFRHNIFNFQIDIPQNWIFGVIGTHPHQEIMMYPEKLNTGKFSKSYETISVGIIQTPNISLIKAYKDYILGMEMIRSNMVVVQNKTNLMLNGNKAISYIYKWPSKTGFNITESIFLVQYKQRIYSIAIRTIDPISKENKKIQIGIINTFKPIKPIRF